jgi:hypothetical protein
MFELRQGNQLSYLQTIVSFIKLCSQYPWHQLTMYIHILTVTSAHNVHSHPDRDISSQCTYTSWPWHQLTMCIHILTVTSAHNVHTHPDRDISSQCTYTSWLWHQLTMYIHILTVTSAHNVHTHPEIFIHVYLSLLLTSTLTYWQLRKTNCKA